jgi:hypothetical protein
MLANPLGSAVSCLQEQCDFLPLTSPYTPGSSRPYDFAQENRQSLIGRASLPQHNYG